MWTNLEYAIADGYNGFNVSTDKAQGFNYTIGYKITPQFQVIGRYDVFDPNRDIGNNNRKEYSAGINYFIKGQAVRLILNYVYCQNDARPDSHRIIFATQLLL
uniref:porin n=1 Tax=Candidatus Scatousia sp. TaxID=3085663 RepID=UPI004028A8ED